MSWKLRNLASNTGWLKLGLVVLACFAADVGRAQFSFGSAYPLSGDSGSVANDNTSAVLDGNAPSIAGFPANKPLWYQWTPTVSGEVELDTIGSTNNGALLDTVLGVFTGTSLTTLNQIAANDDLFPINSLTYGYEGYNITGSADYDWVVGPGGSPYFSYIQPYHGPSHLRFNAAAGTTYYFAVDTKSTSSTGLISLQWAYKSSGVFRFATEDIDYWTGLPLYQAAETESDYRVHYVPVGNSPLFTYYNYNVPGVLVTVTRVAGSTGRATVNYTTVDGTSLPFTMPLTITTPFKTNIAYVGAVAGIDYTPVTNTLVFDDYEMSKTILIPIIDAGANGSGGTTNNTVFGVMLSNPQLDPNESTDVVQPRVDPSFSLALVKILNVNADPYGPDWVSVVVTNAPIPPSTNSTLSTNSFIAAFPTNPVVSFQKCNFRVPEDVNDPNNTFGYTTPVTIYVARSPTATNHSAITLHYRINNFVNSDADPSEEWNNWFPLQPGSDYAVPTPPVYATLLATNPDFNMVQGTITFPANGVDEFYQPITFTVTNTTLTKFNRDFKVELYQEISFNSQTVPASAGMVAETTVTILFNDQHPPAGSVDELYNADFNRSLALMPTQVPQTIPQNDPNPGVAGVVNSLVVLPNDETLIAGDFVSYNGSTYPDATPVNRIALVDTNGALDSSFEPASGASGPIFSLASSPGNQFVIGGSFTSFNGTSCSHIARVNANGSLDTTFNSSANGTVWAVAVQPNGQVLIGGDFNSVNSQPRNHLARLNADGTLDTTFDPGTTLNGPVYAIALPPLITLNFANSGSGGTNQTINLGTSTAGTLTVNYNMYLIQADDMQVYYGDTNVAGGTGVLIYDTGSVLGTNSFVLPFGPTNGLTTNFITIVMDQGTGQTGNQWAYNGTVTISAPFNGIFAGGAFAVSGQSYSDVAQFNSDGSLDTAFNPTAGANNPVYALGWQLDGKLVVGGSFTLFNGSAMNRIARLNADGSLDITNFFVGLGADNVVWNITIQPLDGTIYVGGQFASFNGTHRLGFTRLYPNGTVDTTFLDTAYNQFAGLKRIYSSDAPTVLASGVQSDGNVIIGGTFDQVGGGQADTNVCNSLDDELGINESFSDPNLWVEPKTRDGVRNRSSVARLIGGSTPGPGNIGLQTASFAANKSSSGLSVGLVRTNGVLGPVSANFSVQPSTALSGRDFSYDSAPPLFWIAWRYTTSTQTRLRTDGLFGNNGLLQDVFSSLSLADALINNLSAVPVSVINNHQTSGNLDAQFQLANPSGASEFYLGGENIPLGSALGPSAAPFTLIDDTENAGTVGFVSPVYTATNIGAVISLVRSNGTYGTLTLDASTTNGTALAGIDYNGITNLTVSFLQGVVTNSFTVTNLPNGLISTNFVEKDLNLYLNALTGPSGNATFGFGLSNAVLRLINPNFQGYLTLSATNYTGSESAGFISFVVNRVAGSAGTLTVQYATTNGTATNNVDYFGSTNTLQWNNGDASPRTVNIQLINTDTVGTNKQFGVLLSNPTLNGASTPSLFYVGTPPTNSITNATLTIVNDNSYGAVQFSASSYLVDENGGYATITVVRTGGTAGPVSVNYTTRDGSNTSSNVNYAATSGTLTFVTNQTAASFPVSITNDLVQDPTSFYFNVILSNPTNTVLGSPTNAQVNILDAQRYNWPPGSPDGTFLAGMNGDVLALVLQTNGQILAGGNFTFVNGAPDSGIARLNADGSLDSAGFLDNGLYSGANGAVQAIVCQQMDGRVVIGGAFTSADGIARNNIARLMTDGSLDTSFNPGPGADGPVYALAETVINGGNTLYVGGSFNSISGGASPNLARLITAGSDNDGTLDPSFNAGSGPNATVFAVAVYPTNSPFAGKVLIGGAFTNVNNFTLNHIARLNGDGSVDTNFDLNSGANDTVRAIVIQNDGRILIGGDFTNVNGVALNRIARLNTDGSLDATFTNNVGAGVNSTVQAIAVQADNRIVVAGQFTQGNGVTRNRITRLLPTGAVDTTINFGDGANGTIDAVVIQPTNQMLVIGGSFSQYDDQPYAHIARIYGGSVTGSGLLQFSSPAYQVDENGGQALITVSRTGGTSGPNADGTGNITVYFSTANGGTAVAGTNYLSVTNYPLVFPPGEVLETAVVQVMDDGVVTPNLTVNLALTNATAPAGLGAQSTAVLTVINDDSAVSFSTANYSVSENVLTGLAPIDVVRLATTNGICSVDFITTTNGTAVAGVDFIPTNTTITFNLGASNQLVQVPIINNGLPQGNRTVVFALTNVVNAVLFSPSNATLTILNTVVAPGQLCFSATNYVADEGAGIAFITVVRTNGTSGSVSVAYNTVPGTALPGVNYTTTSGTLTFNAGDTTKTFVVPLVLNSLVQGTVNLSVVLSSPTGGATLIAPTNATLNILNDNVGFNFLNATNYVSETNAYASIFVQCLGSPGGPVSVSYTNLAYTSTNYGPAIPGVNYTPVSGTLTFTPGETLQAILVPLIDDPQVTGDLAFTVNLYNPTNGTQLAAPSNTVVVVQDADAGLSFTNPAVSVLKNAGSLVVAVVCSNPRVEPPVVYSNGVPVTTPLSVYYSTKDGTALAGYDYTAVSGTLVFTNGIATNTFTVPIINNSLVMGDRTFTVSLASPTPPGQLVPPSVQTVTIIDNNSGLSFSSPAYTVLKSGVAATITVLRTDNTNPVSSVNFATANGTALAGLDYIATNGTFTFTNGQTSQTFSVIVINNTIVQPDKTVLLQLSNPAGGILLAPYAATLTIHDTSGSYVVPAGSTLIYESGPTNGIIDPGETVSLLFAFRAAGGNNVTNLFATLLPTNGVMPSPTNFQNYYSPLIVGGPSASQPFTFTVSPGYTNSQQIVATFQLTNFVNGVGTNLGTAGFSYTLGTWTTTYSNTAAIIINDMAIATPYPSSINVSNVGGAVVKATVTLTNLSHGSVYDIDALLLAPNAQDTLLMAHVGTIGISASHITLTFDDAAASYLTNSGAITSGTNKPTAYPPLPLFP
ncbi:MAG: Calx-beta domain-containing protein [Limisphaerales bacterium]